MVDNFDLIRPLLKFEEKGDFYFLELLQRKKDGHAVKNGHHNTSRLVKDYYITSVENLDEIREDVIKKCEETGARAYIRLNKRNYQTVSLAFAEQMLLKARTGQEFRNPHTEIASIVGKFHSAGKDKTWIVDIDDFSIDDPYVEKVKEVIANVEQPIGIDKVIATIPTKSGVHLITRKFNLDKFNSLMEDLHDDMLFGKEIPQIHKDNPTILYVP